MPGATEERSLPRRGPMSLCPAPSRAAALMRLWAKHGITPEVVAAAGPPVALKVGAKLHRPPSLQSSQQALPSDRRRSCMHGHYRAVQKG